MKALRRWWARQFSSGSLWYFRHDTLGVQVVAFAINYAAPAIGVVALLLALVGVFHVEQTTP